MMELPYAITEILKAYQSNNAPALRNWARIMIEWAEMIEGEAYAQADASCGGNG